MAAEWPKRGHGSCVDAEVASSLLPFFFLDLVAFTSFERVGGSDHSIVAGSSIDIAFDAPTPPKTRSSWPFEPPDTSPDTTVAVCRERRAGAEPSVRGTTHRFSCR